MGTSSQKCQYRDPTISTWEYKCCKPSIPLLPYCAEHLVLVKEPGINTSTVIQSQALQFQNPTTPGSPTAPSLIGHPDTPSESQQLVPSSSPASVTTETGNSDKKATLSPGSGKGKPECGNPQKPTSKKSNASKSRAGADGNANQSEIQFTPQVSLDYFFIVLTHTVTLYKAR